MAPVAFVESTDSYSATTATGAIQCFRGRMFVGAQRNKLFVLIQDVLETLEEKRKAKAAVYYEHKKKVEVRCRIRNQPNLFIN